MDRRLDRTPRPLPQDQDAELKIIPPNMSFRQALKRGFVGRIEDRQHLDWVKQQLCCACEQPADDPHHIVSVGYKGQSTKSPDWWAIPLCRHHHDALHHNVSDWEQTHGPQIEHALVTLTHKLWLDR